VKQRLTRLTCISSTSISLSSISLTSIRYTWRIVTNTNIDWRKTSSSSLSISQRIHLSLSLFVCYFSLPTTSVSQHHRSFQTLHIQQLKTPPTQWDFNPDLYYSNPSVFYACQLFLVTTFFDISFVLTTVKLSVPMKLDLRRRLFSSHYATRLDLMLLFLARWILRYKVNVFIKP
jgi:hypothetical protein